MRINDYAVKISSKPVSIDEPLEMGDTVHIMIEGSVTSIKQEDNQDGTMDVIYKIDGSMADIKFKGKVINSENPNETL